MGSEGWRARGPREGIVSTAACRRVPWEGTSRREGGAATARMRWIVPSEGTMRHRPAKRIPYEGTPTGVCANATVHADDGDTNLFGGRTAKHKEQTGAARSNRDAKARCGASLDEVAPIKIFRFRVHDYL